MLFRSTCQRLPSLSGRRKTAARPAVWRKSRKPPGRIRHSSSSFPLSTVWVENHIYLFIFIGSIRKACQAAAAKSPNSSACGLKIQSSPRRRKSTEKFQNWTPACAGVTTVGAMILVPIPIGVTQPSSVIPAKAGIQFGID